MRREQALQEVTAALSRSNTPLSSQREPVDALRDALAIRAMTVDPACATMNPEQ